MLEPNGVTTRKRPFQNTIHFKLKTLMAQFITTPFLWEYFWKYSASAFLLPYNSDNSPASPVEKVYPTKHSSAVNGYELNRYVEDKKVKRMIPHRGAVQSLSGCLLSFRRRQKYFPYWGSVVKDHQPCFHLPFSSILLTFNSSPWSNRIQHAGGEDLLEIKGSPGNVSQCSDE